jgi:hypothetical protein
MDVYCAPANEAKEAFGKSRRPRTALNPLDTLHVEVHSAAESQLIVSMALLRRHRKRHRPDADCECIVPAAAFAAAWRERRRAGGGEHTRCGE